MALAFAKNGQSRHLWDARGAKLENAEGSRPKAMADWKREVVTVHGAAIELLRAGQGDPILILHGSWGNLAPRLI